MKALVYNKKEKEFSLQEIAVPKIKGYEVLVKVKAVSLNAADYRSLEMGIVPKSGVFGSDVSGVVVDCGPGVTGFQKGDEVFGDLSESGSGGLAEYVCAPEKFLLKKPEGLSHETAAAVPMAGVTALQGLKAGKVSESKKVLINGATGGVGTFAVQIAKAMGTHVTAVCGEKNSTLVQSLGADVILDYTKTDLRMTEERFDLILGIQGNTSPFVYRRLLREKGIFVLVGGAVGNLLKTLFWGPFLSLGKKKVKVLAAKPNTQDLSFLIELIHGGKLKAVIEKTYTFDEALEAFGYLKQGHAYGKVVVKI